MFLMYLNACRNEDLEHVSHCVSDISFCRASLCPRVNQTSSGEDRVTSFPEKKMKTLYKFRITIKDALEKKGYSFSSIHKTS